LRLRVATIVTTILIAIGFFSTAATARAGKLSKDLEGLGGNSSIDVIVQFNGPCSLADVDKVLSHGGKLKTKFKKLCGGVFTVPAQALSSVAGDSGVKYVSPDRRVTGALEFAEPTVGANIAFQYGWTGNSVGVAVVDSGIAADHSDLRPRVVYSESFVPGDSGTDDVYGHGTHVAGIIGGNASASSGPSYNLTFRGIAPKANLINLRVLDSNGQGTDSGVIAAIERAIDLKSTYGIQVLNLSLGRTIRESYTLDPLCQAVQKAWQAGIVVIVAAGNGGRDNSMGTGGYSTIASPANSPSVITVGAMNDKKTTIRGDDLITSYSSKGPTLLDQIVKPDLVAPGNVIVSALAPAAAIKQLYPGNVVPVSYYRTSNSSNASYAYFRLSGTSMAAPMVSGAAALVLQKDPALSPDQVKARLMKNASKSFPATSLYVDPASGTSYQSTYDIFTIGAGYLDVWAALNSNEWATGSARSPKAVYDVVTGATTIVAEPGSIWNSAVIWGTSAVWGTNVIVDGTASVWGTAVIWGGVRLQAYSVIWGSAVVWGTDQPFPEAVAHWGDR
jgi:serine protease AprX